MKKTTFYLLSLITLVSFTNMTAQVGVGTTTPEGALDLNPTIATNFGFNAPRIALTALNAQAPVINPQGGTIPAGTVIYNTATANTGVAAPPNNIEPGFYYWNSVKWVAFTGSAGGLDWSLTGNGSTNPGTNFIGTTDSQDLRFKTGGTDRLNLSQTTGQLQTYSIGSAVSPSYSFQADQNTGIFSSTADNLNITTGGTERVKIDNNGNVGIGNTPTEKLDVTGNIRFSGALMPNNISGTTGKSLLSAGAGIAPTWSPYTYSNLLNTTEVSKYFSSLSLPAGAPGNWANGARRIFVITGPVTIRSTLNINFIGPYTASVHTIDIQNIVSEAGQITITAVNVSGSTIGGGSVIPISIAGFF